MLRDRREIHERICVIHGVACALPALSFRLPHPPVTYASKTSFACTACTARQGCASDRLIDTAVLGGPKVFVVATLASVRPAAPFAFRNYELPEEAAPAAAALAACAGSCKHHVWEVSWWAGATWNSPCWRFSDMLCAVHCHTAAAQGSTNLLKTMHQAAASLTNNTATGCSSKDNLSSASKCCSWNTPSRVTRLVKCKCSSVTCHVLIVQGGILFTCRQVACPTRAWNVCTF